MKRFTSTIAVLALSISIVSCKPVGTDSEAPDEAQSPPPMAAAQSKPIAGSPPTYPKAQSSGTDEMIEAFYPSPMLVQRCLSLVSTGPADRVKDVCTRALRLEPGNTQIRAALAAP